MASDQGVSPFSSIELPCGRTLKNRLVKIALYEHFAQFNGGPPNECHYQLYSTWANYDWGIIITGNIQVSPTHLTLGRDVIIPKVLNEATLQPFRQLAESIHTTRKTHSDASHATSSHATLAIMQLSHGGRQSSNFIGGRLPFQPPLAPSAVRLEPKNASFISKLAYNLLFQKPREMTKEDIDEAVEHFVRGAVVAAETGFDGVELHAAHGCLRFMSCLGTLTDLLAGFISPKTNERTDEYSAFDSNALRLLHRICTSIRAKVPATFVLGIKLNAGDYVQGSPVRYHPDLNASNAEERAIRHLQEISKWGGIDFIEISGGDYGQPDFMTATSSARQAFFSRFSRHARQVLHPPTTSQPSSSLPQLNSDLLPTRPPLILLTGGFRTPAAIVSALSQYHTHLLGIGRQSILSPNLPSLLRSSLENHQDHDEKVHKCLLDEPFRPEPQLLPRPDSNWAFVTKVLGWMPQIPLIGAGAEMTWYNVQMRTLVDTHSKNTAIHNGSGQILWEPDYSMGGMMAIVRFWLWMAPGSWNTIWLSPYVVVIALLVLFVAIYVASTI